MSVLTLAGKPINWDKPPKATARVLWSQRTSGGKVVTGSLRSIAHLDRLNYLSVKKFGVGITVYQSAYNSSVAASAGTHDYDACFDVWINGVSGLAQQGFFRANGAGAYYRTPEQGFTPHIHYFCLPPREGVDVSDDYRSGGFKVGKYVDGGWSTAGARTTSSQIEDYYRHRNALASHAPDPTWFPPDIASTIFDLSAYIERQRKATAVKRGVLNVMTANIASQKKVPELPPVLTTHKPDVVIITEAYFAREFLKAIKGYRSYQYTAKDYGEEGPDVAVLVRAGAKVSRRRALRMEQRWTSPKGRQREGRVYPSLNVTTGGYLWRVLGLHFPTTGNTSAQVESQQAVRHWFSLGDHPSVGAGDINQRSDEIEKWLPNKVDMARGTKVDHALYATAEHQKTVRLREDQPEGMHGWLLYKFATL